MAILGASSPTGTAIAPVKLCHFHLPPSPNYILTFTSRLPTSGIPNLMTRKKHPLLCSLLRTQDDMAASSDGGSGRRDVILQMALSALVRVSCVAVSSPALALTEALAGFRLYSDEVNKYKMSIPQDWQVGAGQTDGVKSITAFYPEVDSASNVSVLITGIGPDFTRLESFGKVDAFAETLVSGLDRSWQRPPGVAAKLIDCKAANGLYYIEYTLQNPGESRRHIYSAIGMANNGWYNRLYTVTGQYVEEEAEKYSSMIEKAVQSFRLS